MQHDRTFIGYIGVKVVTSRTIIAWNKILMCHKRAELNTGVVIYYY